MEWNARERPDEWANGLSESVCIIPQADWSLSFVLHVLYMPCCKPSVEWRSGDYNGRGFAYLGWLGVGVRVPKPRVKRYLIAK